MRYLYTLSRRSTCFYLPFAKKFVPLRRYFANTLFCTSDTYLGSKKKEAQP